MSLPLNPKRWQVGSPGASGTELGQARAAVKPALCTPAEELVTWAQVLGPMVVAFHITS